MNRDATGLTIIGHGFRNSYEHTVTSLGDVFQNDNDDPPACRVSWMMEGAFFGFFSRDGKRTWKADQRPGQSVPVAHWRQEDPGTTPPGDVYGNGSPTGVAYYENGALPEKYNGLLLSCEARSQVVFGYYPKPQGAGFALERFDFFKANPGTQFRPSDVMVGADGALYVSDWYDPGVGGHADRDASTSGTIYRIAPQNFQPPTSYATDPVSLLASPSPNVRDAGWVALQAMGEKLLPAVEPLLKDSNPYLRARAVWLLPFAGEKGKAMTVKMLASESSAERLLAFRSLRNAGHKFSDEEMNHLVADVKSVRREFALSLRYAPTEEKVRWTPKLFADLPEGDRHYLEACGLAAEGAETEIWNALHSALRDRSPSAWSDAFARTTWRLQPEAAIPALVARVNDKSLTKAQRELALDTIAFTRSASAANAMAKIAAQGDQPAASRWLLNRASGEWSEFGVADKLKQLGIYDPDKVTVTELLVPEAPKESALPPISEILKLKGDAKNGKLVAARCHACHQIEGQGVHYGPDLRGWVADQGVEPFLQAVIHPSAEIAHGYGGAEVQLKDGRKIHGLVINQGDPIIVQSMGGITQYIPKKLGAKIGNLPRSLMLSADQLGMSAQDLADLTAYLQQIN